MVVKWFPTCVLHRVQERGLRKRGYRTATVFGGQTKKIQKQRKNTIHVFFFCKNLSITVAVMTFLCVKFATSVFTMSGNHMIGSNFGRPHFDHFAQPRDETT